MANEFFDEVRDLLKISVGPVGLEHRELGIVFSRNAFIPEIAIELENFVEPAHEQALEIKFRGDAQIKVKVERLVMCLKRLRRCAACNCLQHRCFDLKKTSLLEETADLAHDRNPLGKCFPRLLVRNQIKITFAVARFDILQAMPFFW
jgi:hypothetical protein